MIDCGADSMHFVPLCIVCMKRFGIATEDHRPHSLPCGHSLCYRCLGRLLKSSASQKCPKCRQPLENAAVCEFPRNFSLDDMMDNHWQQQQQQLQDAVLHSKISPEDLQLTDDVIGWGAAGVERRGVLTCRGNHLMVAVKVLSAYGGTPAEASNAEQEINTKANAAKACSQVVRVLAHCSKDQQVCLVMLLHEDSLVTLVEGGMSQQQKLQTAWQLAKAVQQLHERHILNLNIKPKSVILNDFGDVVLSGPGTLRQMPADSQSLPLPHSADNLRCMAYQSTYQHPRHTAKHASTSQNLSLTVVQVACLQPNPCVAGLVKLHNSQTLFQQRSADVRALACTILYMFTQTLPFDDMNTLQIGGALQAGQVPAIPDSLPLDLQRMLHQCFTWPNSRSTAALMALKFQAMIEDTSVCQAGDKILGMPLPANASSHQPNPILKTGGSAGQEVAALARSVLELQSNRRSLRKRAARRIESSARESQENRNAIIAAGALPPLAALLRSDKPAVQEQAAGTLFHLAAWSQHIKEAIIAADVVPLLIKLLRSDQPLVQAAAAIALYILAHGSQENRDAITGAGALPLLVTLLRSPQSDVQVTAVGALANLANGSQENTDDIVAAGAVPLLVALLRSDQPAVQEHAALALANHADGSQKNTDDIVATGAVPLLVALLSSDQPAVPAQAAWTLANLADGSEHIQNAINAAGSAPLLTELLRSDQPAVQEVAAAALYHLTAGSQQNLDAVIAAGSVPLLIQLLRSDQPEPAVAALCNLAFSSLENKAAIIIEAQALPLLVMLLSSEEPSVQERTACTLANLAAESQCNQDVIIAAGSVPLLTELLRSDEPAVQENAAKALCNLATDSQKNLDAITAAGAFPLLVTLLGSDQPAVQGPAAGTLVFLAYSSQKIRDDIMAAGVVPLLVALLTDEPDVQEIAAHSLGSFAYNSPQNQDAIVAAGAVPLLLTLSKQPHLQSAAAFALDNLPCLQVWLAKCAWLFGCCRLC